MEKISEAIVWYLAFVLSITLHEASHAFFAMKLGDLTAYNNGQVTLNPIPHMKREPIGTIVVPLISFFLAGWMMGWASAPYNYQWAYNNPKKSGAMAAGGPLANLLLVLLAALLIHIGIISGVFYQPDSITISSIVEGTGSGIFNSAAKFISVLFSLNLILLIFNLLPVPPLDGSGMIPLWLSDNSGKKYLEVIHNSAFSVIGILIAWNLFDLIYWQIHLFCINLLYFGSNYQ